MHMYIQNCLIPRLILDFSSPAIPRLAIALNLKERTTSLTALAHESLSARTVCTKSSCSATELQPRHSNKDDGKLKRTNKSLHIKYWGYPPMRLHWPILLCYTVDLFQVLFFWNILIQTVSFLSFWILQISLTFSYQLFRVIFVTDHVQILLPRNSLFGKKICPASGHRPPSFYALLFLG